MDRHWVDVHLYKENRSDHADIFIINGLYIQVKRGRKSVQTRIAM